MLQARSVHIHIGRQLEMPWCVEPTWKMGRIRSMGNRTFGLHESLGDHESGSRTVVKPIEATAARCGMRTTSLSFDPSVWTTSEAALKEGGRCQ